MKLLNLSKLFSFFYCFFIFITPLKSADTIDIWKKENKGNKIEKKQTNQNQKNEKLSINKDQNIIKEISILNELREEDRNKNLFGLYDPDENNLNLNIWVNSDGNDIKDTFLRINKLKLSRTAEEFFEKVIMTYAYPPKSNLTNEEFLSLKINWLINNKKDKQLENFLNKNNNFLEKKKIIQYLVDKSIAKADISEACNKSEFISKEIKDSYLEKFKIYCLIFNDRKEEARLVYDILMEEKLSDSFFEKKINFLLGIVNKPDNLIKDDNLLNFYLSSITIPNFKYEPNEKTNNYIWEYINSANLITLEDIKNKEKIKNLELAANNNTLDKNKIFDIYRRIQFDINTLINAENIYQSLDGIDARALIFQKALITENPENKIKLLVLLKEQFKKDNLSNVYSEYMSEQLEILEQENLSDSYKEILVKNIISNEEAKLGKIKYDDKILHKSRILRYYTEANTPSQKTQKDLENIYKKIKRNKKYFFSTKDLVLIESLEADGFKIPKDIKHKELSQKYTIPETLINLIKNEELGLLSLKFVEIIGEDDANILDPETIYFITNILNKAKLTKLRNKVLISSLPFRR